MKEKEGISRCPCGQPISVVLKKPTASTFSVAKIDCKRCKSRFFVQCRKNNEGYHVEFELLELSKFGEEMVRWRIDNPGRQMEKPRGLKGLLSSITQRFRV